MWTKPASHCKEQRLYNHQLPARQFSRTQKGSAWALNCWVHVIGLDLLGRSLKTLTPPSCEMEMPIPSTDASRKIQYTLLLPQYNSHSPQLFTRQLWSKLLASQSQNLKPTCIQLSGQVPACQFGPQFIIIMVILHPYLWKPSPWLSPYSPPGAFSLTLHDPPCTLPTLSWSEVAGRATEGAARFSIGHQASGSSCCRSIPLCLYFNGVHRWPVFGSLWL